MVHPIEYTMDQELALQNLLDCYGKAFEDEMHPTVCTQPFMVFCSASTYATFLVEMLQKEATKLGTKPDRIKGVWASMRLRDKFVDLFAQDPETYAQDAEVVVCTSVVGAGFSVSTHFVAFHGFLFNNILTHHEEQQFIRRLRFVMDTLPPNAVRQFYLWVEHGFGQEYEFKTAVKNFAAVRDVIIASRTGSFGNVIDPNCCRVIETLAQTQARIEVEQADSRRNHLTLWEQWGGSIESEFVLLPTPDNWEEEGRLILKKAWTQWNNQFSQSIADVFKGQLEEGISPSQEMEALELGTGLSMFVEAAIGETHSSLSDLFVSETLTLAVMKEGCLKNEFAKFVTKPQAVMTQLKRIVTWFSFIYRQPAPGDRSESFWSQYERRGGSEYRRSSLNVIGALKVGTDVLIPLFSHQTPNAMNKYLIAAGTILWFTGLVFAEHVSLGESLKRLLEDEETDDATVKKRKSFLRSAVINLTGKQDRLASALTQAYEDPRKAVAMIKKLFQFIGLTVTSTGKRIAYGQTRKYEKTIQFRMLHFALILGMKRRSWSDKILEILHPVMTTENLCEEDKQLVQGAIELHNHCCYQCHMESHKLTLHLSPPTNRINPVVSYRIEDARIEREVAIAAGTYTTPEQQQTEIRRELEVGETLATLYQSVAADDALVEPNAELRRRERHPESKKTLLPKKTLPGGRPHDNAVVTKN